MKKNLYPYIAFMVLISTALACAFSIGSPQPSGDEVATVVASTMQALTPVSGGGGVAAFTSVPVGSLPHPLYFLNDDGVGVSQVFRLGTDGRTLTQVTFEPAAVESYDVSQTDGSVIYVSNNQLLMIKADGSGRRVLADGGPVDPDNLYAEGINNPVFSPDGQTIAYAHKGLILYALSTGAANKVLEKLGTDPISGGLGPRVLYVPQKYSPDGTKILITVAIPNSDGISSGIYNVITNTLTLPSGGDGARLCCGEQAWTSDSSALYVGIPFVGMFASGLWRVDAATGNLTTLLPTEAGGGNFNLANQPYLAPDGQLYFFFASQPAPDGFIDNNAPLQIVRSAPDGVTDRTVLRPETFESVNRALWAPDASFVIVTKLPADRSVYDGGAVELYYTDATKSVIPLLPFGRQLKWGP